MTGLEACLRFVFYKVQTRSTENINKVTALMWSELLDPGQLPIDRCCHSHYWCSQYIGRGLNKDSWDVWLYWTNAWKSFLGLSGSLTVEIQQCAVFGGFLFACFFWALFFPLYVIPVASCHSCHPKTRTL